MAFPFLVDNTAFLLLYLMYDSPSDVDVTFSKWESPIIVYQCCMPLRQTVVEQRRNEKRTV
jgi:hypothetical protein